MEACHVWEFEFKPSDVTPINVQLLETGAHGLDTVNVQPHHADNEDSNDEPETATTHLQCSVDEHVQEKLTKTESADTAQQAKTETVECWDNVWTPTSWHVRSGPNKVTAPVPCTLDSCPEGVALLAELSSRTAEEAPEPPEPAAPVALAEHLEPQAPPEPQALAEPPEPLALVEPLEPLEPLEPQELQEPLELLEPPEPPEPPEDPLEPPEDLFHPSQLQHVSISTQSVATCGKTTICVRCHSSLLS